MVPEPEAKVRLPAFTVRLSARVPVPRPVAPLRKFSASLLAGLPRAFQAIRKRHSRRASLTQ